MNTGKYAAFRQLTTPKSDLSDTIVKQEELQNQFDEKQELKAKKKKEAQIAKTKDIAKINSGPRTQYLNVEHTFMDGFKKQGGIIEVFSNAKEAFEKDPTNTEAYGIMQNINNGVEKIALAKETIIGYDKLMSEGIANRDIDPNRNRKFRSVLKDLNKGKFNLNVDKYGNISIENLAIDRDKDGKFDVITPESLSDKNAWGDWQGYFNLSAYNTKMKKDFGTKQEKGQDLNGKPFDTIHTKGFDPANTLLVRNRYKQTFGKDSDNLTSDGVSILYQLGFDLEKNPITEVEYQSFLDARVEEFKQMYDRSELKESGVRSRLATQNSDTAKHNALKNKNSLRVTVDGIMAGDKKYYFGLKNKKLEEQGSKGQDIYIRDVNYSEGILKVFTSDKKIRNIDTSKDSAVSSILKLVRPNDDIDKRLEEYENGSSDIKYTELKNSFPSIEIKKLGDNFSSEKAFELTQKLKLDGFKLTDSWFNKRLKMPDGTEIDTSTKEGGEKFMKYLKQNWNQLTSKPYMVGNHSYR